MNYPLIPFEPTHPGSLILDEMPENGIKSQKQLAELMSVSHTYLNEVINGKRSINASLALKLETALCISAEYWLRFQAQYDIDTERKKLQKSKTAIHKTPLYKRTNAATL